MLYIYYGRLQNASTSDGSAAVRTLLNRILTRLHLPTSDVNKSPEGRPFLQDVPFLDISFSHTVSLAICALLDTRPLVNARNAPSPSVASEYRIGIDAEPIVTTPVRDPLAFSRRFFGMHEQAYVNSTHDAARTMLAVFTAKEAYAKQCGDGLAAHLSKTDTMAPDFCESRGVCFKRLALANHTVTLCLPASLSDIDVTCVEIEL